MLARRYKVRLTVQAIGPIEEAMGYIAEDLLESGTARKRADTLEGEIAALTDMPRDGTDRLPCPSHTPLRPILWADSMKRAQSGGLPG